MFILHNKINRVDLRSFDLIYDINKGAYTFGKMVSPKAIG